MQYCLEAARRDERQPNLLRQCLFQYEEGRLRIQCAIGIVYKSLVGNTFKHWLREVAAEYFGKSVEVEVINTAQEPVRNDKLQRENIESNPTVKRLQEELGARIIPGSVKETR